MSLSNELRDPKGFAASQVGASRLLALDGLRGAAALGVAVYHRQFFFLASRDFLPEGWIFVDLFFLISGVVMMHVYEERIVRGTIGFAEFLTHRIARLWPLHLFAMLSMGVLVALHEWRHPGLFHLMNWDAPLYTFVLNLFLLQNIGLFQAPTWDGNAWSLSPEIALNLLWFYLVSRGRLTSRLLVAAVAVAAVALSTRGPLNGGLWDSHLVRSAISFGWGCLLYRHFLRHPPSGAGLAAKNVWSAVVSALFLAITFLVPSKYSALATHWDYLCVLFLFPAAVYLTLQEGTFLNRIFSSKPFVFLGLISYSVYLLHVQIAIVLQDAFFLFHTQVKAPFAGLLFLAIVIVAATLTFHFVENPCRRRLRSGLQPFLEKICFDIDRPATPSPRRKAPDSNH